MYNYFKHKTQLLFITLFAYSDMQRNTNLDLHKEISEMFLELSNVIIEAEQSLNKHLYLCTANRKKYMTVNIHCAHDGDMIKKQVELNSSMGVTTDSFTISSDSPNHLIPVWL